MVGKEDCNVKNFEAEIEKRYKIPKNLKISKAVKLTYYPNGQVDLYESYNGIKKEFHINIDLTFENLENSQKSEFHGITKEKVKDLRALIPYVSPDAKKYFEEYLKSVPIRGYKSEKFKE